MLHRWQRALAALTATTLLAAGCAPQVVTIAVTSPPETVVVTATPSPSPSPTATSQGPKTLTICLAGEPDTLYLYGGSRLPATQHVMEAIYDGPIDRVRYGYQAVILEKIPRLADGDARTRTVRVRKGDRVVDASGEVVELDEGVRVRLVGCRADECAVEFEEEPLRMERMEVTFALRRDVTWADGEPLTAADSVFAFQVASDPATPGGRDLVERTAEYRALDEWRVRWLGVPGFVDPAYSSRFFAPLPRHQLEGRSAGELLRADDTRRTPLGWGPYVVEEWVPGDHITVVRNPRYFRAAEGLPNLDRVEFRFTSGGPEVIARLLAGECDVGTADADLEAYLPLLVQAEQRGLLKVVSAPGNGWEHFDFGLAPVPEYRRADFFGDVRVRQAIAQCIDRQAIVDEVTYGLSAVSDSYVPPEHPLYAGDELALWEYDPVTGRALLEEMGWLDEDGDGVREARGTEGVPGGTLFEVTLLTAGDRSSSLQAARIAKAHLADCGIRVNVKTQPTWELLSAGPGGSFFGRRFDIAQTAWWFDVVPPCEHYLSSEIPDEGRWDGGNPSGFESPEFDAACQAALQALPGSPEYEGNHRQAQIIFSQDLPALPLYMGPRVGAAMSKVLNYGPDPTARSELWNIEELDLD
jgi:peptide/nickel transport system substrate-binding protein